MSIREENGQKTRLYNVWKCMRQRCRNPSNPAYDRYGGRGISIATEWDSFEVFHEWAMNHGYQENLSLDRIDVNGNYEPSNCRWATDYEQANNTRSNRKITYNGQEMNFCELSRLIDIPVTTLHNRLDKLGWSPEEAFRKEKRRKPNCTKVTCVETGQEFGSLKEASEWAGISYVGILRCYEGKQKSAGGYHWMK